MFDQSILSFLEKSVFSLREIFIKNGYRQFKMSKFEEYDLYSKNKDFLVSDGVITFNDTNGKLLALKPDVTLSIIKNSKDNASEVQKYFYSENVYRISQTSHTYKEIMQTGLECIGNINFKQVVEVTSLAIQSLKKLSSEFVLQISNVALLNALFSDYLVEKSIVSSVMEAISQKNVGYLKQLLAKEQYDALKVLVNKYDSIEDCINQLQEIAKTDYTKDILNDFKRVCAELIALGYENDIQIDFSIVSLDGYYSGIVFKGFANGISSKVLSGGQYDNLMKKMGRKSGAIGFAVYLDEFQRADQIVVDDYINVALPKGRLGEKVYDMFEKAGFECPSIKENNRKLIFENKQKKLRFFWVKPSDVTIYVERGSADIGVAGKDILQEYSPDVFELLDLNVGKCNMCVASKKDFVDDESKTLRVATKFSSVAKEYYAKKCRDIDIIHLNGSIEIAPILGLSDVIVDIVETGKTLIENDLVPFETIFPISARLIANKSSFGFKSQAIRKIKQGLYEQVKNND